MNHWPYRLMPYGATKRRAQRLAREVLVAAGSDPFKWCRVGRFEIKTDDLGGIEALCIPMNNDRFRFVLARGHSPAARAFLVCHEAAHTFFYIRRDGVRPQRAFSVRGNEEWEEAFCDAFAFTVTGFVALPDGLARRKEAA